MENKSCTNCGSNSHSGAYSERKNKCKAFKEVCGRCKKIGHYTNKCRTKIGMNAAIEEENAEDSSNGEIGMFFQLDGVTFESTDKLEEEFGVFGEIVSRKSPQMESESPTGWKKSKLKDHGILEVEIKSCQEGYKFFNLPVRQFFGKVSAVTDSGDSPRKEHHEKPKYQGRGFD